MKTFIKNISTIAILSVVLLASCKKEFLNTTRTVLVLESGGFDADARYQKLYESDVAGLPHAGINTGRARVFGGTTTLWGGQALRFDTLDLAKRDWVPYSGWPLTCADC